MAKEIEEILKNDAINTALKTLSEKLGTTMDSLVDEFIRYYIGTRLFWVIISALSIIVISIIAYCSAKKFFNDDNDLDWDVCEALSTVLVLSIFIGIVFIIVFLYNVYGLVSIYCSPTITLIKYLHDTM